jgi:ATP-dependent DNA helicase DinG
LRHRLARLYSARSGQPRGLIPALARRLRTLNWERAEELAAIDRVQDSLSESLPELVRDCAEAITLLFDLGRFAMEQRGERGRETAESPLRLRAQARGRIEVELQEALREPLEEARRRLAILASRGEAILQTLDELSDSTREPIEGFLREFQSKIERAGELAKSLEVFGAFGDQSHVRWIEVNRTRGGVMGSLRAVPLELSPLLRHALWDRLGSGVMTSATLQTDQGFRFVQERLGLTGTAGARLRSLAVDSPFEYSKQALLVIPDDGSEVQERGFMADVCYLIERLTRLSEGRSFVLFTSYSMLKDVMRRVGPELKRHGLEPMAQGEIGRRELLTRFKATRGAVLFGTDSFWEGVDVPGEQLSQVIIVKLPFAVPSDPVQEARAELVSAGGGDPFQELTLPQAVLRMRQGFGRLIRRGSDRGVVAILDRRILTKGYGGRILAALPPARLVRGPFEGVIVPAVRSFFASS